jgi:hypothetical protein
LVVFPDKVKLLLITYLSISSSLASAAICNQDHKQTQDMRLTTAVATQAV